MRASMLLITFLCVPLRVNRTGCIPEIRPPGCSAASGVLQGMFVAIGNRKLMFLTKYSLLHTFFIAKLWSKMSFLDEDCKPQMISGTSLHRQHEKTKLLRKFGHQLSACSCCQAWPDLQDTFHRGRKVDRFFPS